MHSLFENFHLDQVDAPESQVSANSSWIQPFNDDAHRACYILSWGAVGTNITMKVTQATTSGGGSAKDVTGATLSVITAASKWGYIEFAPGALDLKNGFVYTRAEVTVNGTVVWGLFFGQSFLRYPGTYAQASSLQQAVKVYFQE